MPFTCKNSYLPAKEWHSFYWTHYSISSLNLTTPITHFKLAFIVNRRITHIFSSPLHNILSWNSLSSQAVVAHTFGPSNWEAEGGESLSLRVNQEYSKGILLKVAFDYQRTRGFHYRMTWSISCKVKFRTYNCVTSWAGNIFKYLTENLFLKGFLQYMFSIPKKTKYFKLVPFQRSPELGKRFTDGAQT